jgi:tRNA(fMet)-specific endonuclease VapC
MVIADTSFIIDVMKKEEKAVVKAEEIVSRRDTIQVTTPSLFELYSGQAQSLFPELEKEKILALLKNQALLSLDAEGARLAGDVHGQLRKKGMPIGVVDCLIAGIALAEHETVVTKNVKDFRKVPGLLVDTN